MKFAACHTNRLHIAKGLCRVCYKAQRYDALKASGYYETNKARILANQARYRATHKGIIKAKQNINWLRYNYNISQEEYDSLLNNQNGFCAICKELPQPRKNIDRLFCIDHDHKCCPGSKSCGKCVRGLLCHPCNIAIAYLREREDLFESAMEYLKGGQNGRSN